MANTENSSGRVSLLFNSNGRLAQEERSSSGYGFEKVPKNNPFPREGKSRGNSRSVSKGWSLIKRTLFTPMGNNEGNGPKKNVRGKKHEDMNVETYDDFEHDFGTFQPAQRGHVYQSGGNQEINVYKLDEEDNFYNNSNERYTWKPTFYQDYPEAGHHHYRDSNCHYHQY